MNQNHYHKDLNFYAKLEGRWTRGNFVCVGLDPVVERIPSSIAKRYSSLEDQIFRFNQAIIDATADAVCAFKPNSAFYEQYGDAGQKALEETVLYIKETQPDIPIILDAKRGDIGNTNLGYVTSAFDNLEVDGITVNPYLGRKALKPFLDRRDKGIIVLARTSNRGAGEFQDLLVGESQEPLYLAVARQVAADWNVNGNVGLVAGATYPEELARIRMAVGDIPLLIPGIGTQGGQVEPTIRAGKDSRGMGMIVNSSSGIIFASNGNDYAQAAREAAFQLRTDINRYR